MTDAGAPCVTGAGDGADYYSWSPCVGFAA